MKRFLLPALASLVPLAAFALDFDDLTARYTDAPFSEAETAGISVLTEVAAVQGNPDGSFAAGRTLNRAEFTKIALIAGRAPTNGHDGCFPDAPAGAWYTPYVCAAEEQGIVEGNPDGLFHPERAVNYVEAVKILVEIFGYELPVIDASRNLPWYTPYLLAANDYGVLLPEETEPGHELTRGQMARLAAAFIAESEGELEAYRAFEDGQSPPSSSSSVSSSTSSISSIASSSSISSITSSSTSSAPSSSVFPALSHFLVPGETTGVLFDGVFTSPDDDGSLRAVEVELRNEIRSIESFVLVDATGTEIAVIPLQNTNNDDDTKWRVEVESGTYVLPQDQGVRLGLKARVKDADEGATSNELVEIESFALRVTGMASAVSRQLVATDTNYPLHQTAFGRITAVRNGLASTMTLDEGDARTIGTFTVEGKAASGTSLAVESLTFILQTSGVNASHFRIGGATPILQRDCATEQSQDRVLLTCFVPESMQSLNGGPVTLSVYANVSVAAAQQSGTIHLSALGAAGIGSIGSVRWSDQSTTFSWIEGDAHLESGPVVTVVGD